MSDKSRKPRLTISDLEKQVASQVLEMMEQDGIRWVERWAQPRPCCNGVTGHVYRGTNVLTTAIWLMCAESDDPRFISKAHAFGTRNTPRVGRVAKGEKGIPILAAGSFKVKDEETGEERQRPFWKVHYVWHVSQFSEIDEEALVPVSSLTPPEDPAERDAALEAFVAGTGAVVKDAPSAFYNSGTDWIGMPPIESFVDHGAVSREEFYYATLLHELTHWTGHASRLDRKTLAHPGRKKEDRAREELIAELGAVMLGMQLGVQPQPREDNAAYLASWAQLLTDKPGEIFEAASAAAKAAQFLTDIQPQEEKEAA